MGSVDGDGMTQILKTNSCIHDETFSSSDTEIGMDKENGRFRLFGGSHSEVEDCSGFGSGCKM